MDKKHTAFYNLNAIATQYPGQLQQLYDKYGFPSTPVNAETLAAMIVVFKSDFTSDLYDLASPSYFNPAALYSYDGNTGNTAEKSKFQQWLDKAAGILYGVNSVVNGEEEEPEPDEKKKFLGLPVWAWLLIVLVLLIIGVLAWKKLR